MTTLVWGVNHWFHETRLFGLEKGLDPEFIVASGLSRFNSQKYNLGHGGMSRVTSVVKTSIET